MESRGTHTHQLWGSPRKPASQPMVQTLCASNVVRALAYAKPSRII
uniref:Uncharacterized protein n=1 Tax=Myoviridae sp. ct1Js5 TaxID=2826601 RepID=A0A8S5M9J5_9CAUD|nr:MAG TPA: hypothetical protein [Myoviridae sp. ct1Js5]DAI34704.1 MAG TPA: hypothetical protein [Bacteriophage sp.]DAP13715.1 MAG TPA: hypothetical protein [Caudoviricetes sp.]DAU51162.1 MAG TPA: hypothetical protein [Caudoviricetes sp.]DAV05435.1 MAG TPA: hypothetical protein [Caudoviricetes sp.]